LDNNSDEEVTVFTVDQESSGQRIDKFLAHKIKSQSRSHIQKVIVDRHVSVNGKIVSKNFELSNNDIITIKNFYNREILKKQIKPQNIDLNIVFEDEYFLIISKAAGITVHPAPGSLDNTLVNAILFYLKKNPFGNSYTQRPGIVHRLDKDTSGLIIIAKNDIIAGKISEQFKSRTVEKKYIALVSGNFAEKKGEIRLPIGRSRVDRKKMGISIDRGREAVTNFTVIKEFEDCSLLDIFPKTGRTHQIRVHFSYIDHPIIGDKQYGNKESERIARDIGLGRQFLHASKLKFIHPENGKVMEIEDKLAADLNNALNNLSVKDGKIIDNKE
jgi:23S rRNA pseudouridine1911/1915/1917 synthase